MSLRKRTSKLISRRHDLNYFKYTPGLRRWQWRFVLIALGVSIVWIAAAGAFTRNQVFSAGALSSPHAVFSQRCETCHTDSGGMGQPHSMMQTMNFRQHVTDHACLTCHTAPAHQANQLFTPTCGSCHAEHVGSTHLANVSDANCTQCHADLKTSSGAPRFSSGIHSFVSGHPEFPQLRAGATDTSNIKFNHSEHMTANLLGPKGANGSSKNVSLQCGDCHRTLAEQHNANWRFAGLPDALPAAGANAAAVTSTSSLSQAQLLPAMLQAEFHSETQPQMHQEMHPGAQISGRDFEIRPDAGRSHMAPVEYQTNCRACHTLEFDKHITLEAPHKDIATVHQFVVDQLTSFAKSHPDVVAGEIRNWHPNDDLDPATPLPQQMRWPAPHNAQEWINSRVARAEIILYQDKCSLCHTVSLPEGRSPIALPNSTAVKMPAATNETSKMGTSLSAALPTLLPTAQRTHWYENAVFSHEAHQAVRCDSCHAKALTSVDSKDILLPSIKTCQSCHNGESRPQSRPVASGHAQSGCFLCHQYHAWDSRTPDSTPKQTFTIEQLSSLR